MNPEVPIIIIAIAIPLFFLCLRFFKKRNISTQKNRLWIALGFTSFVSPVIYILVILSWLWSNSYYSKTEFNAKVWESTELERYRMSEDIIESKMLLGKSDQEVITLLGPDYIYYNKTTITYMLGFVPGLFNIDPDYLEITLENGIVVSVTQYEG
ncbi:hypothetical protein [Flammeovirga sp. SubArs3]|uniref:hypothetical protein n=1 Tax=Flammeovirga sp. SubArs3 TaxID=2995316 RepID=UPI00248CE0CA|nr:hypothetical protein [Flammeovirga sp. SubArs3]